MLQPVSKMRDQEQAIFSGKYRFNEPMSKHTSWRVGGGADRFYIPNDTEDVVLFLKSLAADEPVYWVGLGSNLLVRDGGIRGTVIFTCGKLKKLESIGQSRVYVEAGVPCAHVARFASAKGLAGAEFLAGIPGTMGGALAMNAGAFGGETWSLVEKVTTVDLSGQLRNRTPTEFRIGYRTVIGPDQEWFLSTELLLNQGDSRESQVRIKQLLAQRAQAQPTNVSSCGSVFRNPPGDYAAALIEASGLKGKRIGGACVSEKHANFIVNTGNATAVDIESLIHLVAEEVERKHGIRLQPEVRIIGVKDEVLQ